MNNKSIVLIGMSGAGKSTTGRLLSEALGFSFTDLDDHISKKDGRTIQEIIDAEDEQSLFQLEKQRMYEIDLTRRVVAPGGSIIYHPDLMEHLKQHATLVYLDESFENIRRKTETAISQGYSGTTPEIIKINI